MPVNDAPIQPLLGKLNFVKNKKAYGAVFRIGMIKIPEPDFKVIESELTKHEKNRKILM